MAAVTGGKEQKMKVCRKCGRTDQDTLFEGKRQTCNDCRYKIRGKKYLAGSSFEKEYEYGVKKRMSELDRMALKAKKRGISYGALQQQETVGLIKKEKKRNRKESRNA